MNGQEARLASWKAHWDKIANTETEERDARKGVKSAMGDRFLVLSEVRKRARSGAREVDWAYPPERSGESAKYLQFYYACLAGFLRANGFRVADLGVVRGLTINWRDPR